MQSFLNLFQRPDILEAFLKANNFSEEEKEIAKNMLKEKSTSAEINISKLKKNK